MLINRRKLIIGCGAAGVAAVAGVLTLFDGSALGERSEDVPEGWTVKAITAEDITAAAQVRVFFGHQSVGMNVIGGLPAVFAANGLPAPDVIELDSDAGPPLPGGAAFTHAYLGENGDPLGKIRDFDARIRGGLGEWVDIALMKLCYVDVTADADVNAIFQVYRTTLAQLDCDFPGVTFIHVTTPLTTEPTGPKAAIKNLLGRPGSSRADNVSRERLNLLIRQRYGADQVFDLAAVETTAPDGTEVSGTFEGHAYHALYGGFASDDGHLNDTGSRLAAARLLGLIARAVTR